MKVFTFRKRSRDTITGQDIIRNGYWQIRSTGREKTEGFVKAKGFGCQVQSWERPGKKKQTKIEKKQEYQDNTDRIEVEREFSVENIVMD